MSAALGRDEPSDARHEVVPEPGTKLGPGSAGGRGWLRTAVAAVLVVVFLAAAVWCGRRGIVTDTWPAFLPDTDSTQITRYEGPWLTAAAVAVLGAGLAVMAALRPGRSS